MSERKQKIDYCVVSTNSNGSPALVALGQADNILSLAAEFERLQSAERRINGRSVGLYVKLQGRTSR